MNASSELFQLTRFPLLESYQIYAKRLFKLRTKLVRYNGIYSAFVFLGVMRIHESIRLWYLKQLINKGSGCLMNLVSLVRCFTFKEKLGRTALLMPTSKLKLEKAIQLDDKVRHPALTTL